MLEWTQSELAEAASVTQRAVVDFERGAGAKLGTDLAAIRTALEAAGVEFTNGDAPGVRLRTPKASTDE